MSERVTGLTTTLTEIDMKANGTATSKMEWERITTQMETSIKESGSTANSTVRETTYIMKRRQCTRESGRKAGKTGWGSWLLTISMGIQGIGLITRRKAMARISIAMAKGTKANGSETRNMETDHIDTRMVTTTTENGRRTIATATGPCNTTTELLTQDNCRRENNMAVAPFPSRKGTATTDSGKTARCTAKGS